MKDPQINTQRPSVVSGNSWLTTIFGVVLLLSASACSGTTPENTVEAAGPAASGAKPLASSAPAAAPQVTMPAGTTVNVVLRDSVGTETSVAGSTFAATIAEPVQLDGRTLLPKGIAVTGRIVDVKRPGKVNGRATLSLQLTSIQLNGRAVPVETRSWVGVAKSSKKRDAALIGGAAGIGAAIGAIAGGGKGTAVGAAVGGAGGTGAVLATRGDELHYGPETRMRFVLTKSTVL